MNDIFIFALNTNIVNFMYSILWCVKTLQTSICHQNHMLFFLFDAGLLKLNDLKLHYGKHVKTHKIIDMSEICFSTDEQNVIYR